jgi:hypothetical protein
MKVRSMVSQSWRRLRRATKREGGQEGLLVKAIQTNNPLREGMVRYAISLRQLRHISCEWKVELPIARKTETDIRWKEKVGRF